MVINSSKLNRLWFRLLLISIGSLLLCFGAFAEHAPNKKAETIAGYLVNIPRLVEWPDMQSDTVIRPFVICILGDDQEIYKSLIHLKNQPIAKRPVKVAIYYDIRLANTCQVVFVSRSEERVLPDIFSHLKGLPILTISDIPGFIASGGVFELRLESKRISILANPACAKKHQLFIRSNLLALASNKSELSEMSC